MKENENQAGKAALIRFISRNNQADEAAAKELFAMLSKEAWAMLAVGAFATQLQQAGEKDNLQNVSILMYQAVIRLGEIDHELKSYLDKRNMP